MFECLQFNFFPGFTDGKIWDNFSLVECDNSFRLYFTKEPIIKKSHLEISCSIWKPPHSSGLTFAQNPVKRDTLVRKNQA